MAPDTSTASGARPRYLRPHAKEASTDWRRHVPRASATVYGLVSLFCLVTALIPRLRPLTAGIRTFLEYFFISAAPSLSWAALLGIVAASLRKRKRVAWWFVVLWHALVAVVAIPVSWADPELIPNAAFAVAVLAVMLVSRREFYAKVTKGSLLWALVTLLVSLAVSIAIGFLLVETFHGSLGSPSDRFQYTVAQVVGSDTNVVGVPPHFVALTLSALGALSYLAAAWALVLPRRKHERLTVEDEVRIRGLLAEYGERDSLGYFATRRDKSVIFSPSGKAAVTYRVQNGVSLASGDPVGDPEAWRGAIDAWIDEARAFAWTPAVVGASEEGAEAFTRAGLNAIAVGDEAIVEFADYSLSGRAMRVVRQAVRRVERAGYTARVRRHSDIPPEQMVEVVHAADAWRDTETERGFSMALGRLGDPADGRCVLVEAIDADGHLRALLSLSPWGTRGVSLDLMRRDRAADNGLMEFMVTELVAAGPRLGIERASLNFAVMRSVFEEGERIGAGPFVRMFRAILLFLSRFWQIESLYRANAKYQPDWVPRLVCYDSAGDLPRVLVAGARAEGFLPSRSPLEALRRRGQPATGLGAGAQVLAELNEAAPEVPAEPAGAELPEQERVRREKLARLRAAGSDPFARSFRRTATVADVRSAHAGLADDARSGVEVTLAGRVVRNRVGGGLTFADVRDGTGDLQLMLSADVAGPDALAAWKADIDLGDQVGVTGEVVRSRRGELSLLVREWTLLGKCLHPLPDKYKGLTDNESRVRQRYVDLIVTPDSRDMVRIRSGVARSIRESLWDRGFVEVETPMLQPIHGGANARPFVTHMNAYDLRLYLRIAPELYLKRLLVGGIEKVFELNRNFRNEGVDSSHNPEFTSLEMYEAYGDYHTMRVLTRELVVEAAANVLGTTTLVRTDASGHKVEIDLAEPWPVRDVCGGISEALGECVDATTPEETLRLLCSRIGAPAPEGEPQGALLERLYGEVCEKGTVQPTFWCDFPRATSPLTRAKPDRPELAERWDLVAFGAELGTAYTELTDPLDQRDRLTAQSLLAAAGDAEAMELDEDFLRALEFAMPPAGGQGMGIDRLVMFLTGKGIRDTILFPLTRPES